MLDAIGRLFWMLDQTSEERVYRDVVAQRVRLTDREFAERFFQGHPHPEIPIAVAGVARHQLGIESLAPDDNLAAAFPDIPFEELVFDVLEELGLSAESIDLEGLDGTVANLVNALSRFLRGTTG